jgi:hypothetical protein
MSVGFAIGGLAPTFTVLFAHTPAELPMSLTVFLVGTSILYLIGGMLVPETRGRINPENGVLRVTATVTNLMPRAAWKKVREPGDSWLDDVRTPRDWSYVSART